MKWKQRAACREQDATLFIDAEDWAAAKSVCAKCDVRQACLDYAIANDYRYGIWGGVAPQERQAQ